MNKTLLYIIFNALYFAFGIASVFLVNNIAPLIFIWLFIAFGNGTVGHRYIAHSQFRVHRLLHWPLAIWCTISGYSTTMYWQVQHRHHHRHTDKTTDIHSPHNGFWYALVLWPFSKSRIESVFADNHSVVNLARSMRDPAVKFTTNFFIPINLCFMLILATIDMNLLYCLGIAFCIEHLRLGLINTITHIKSIPGNYRNHNTKDQSQNNLFLGLLTLGFGWHNNHHADAGKLILTERWWELDPEGYLGKLLSLTSRGNYE